MTVAATVVAAATAASDTIHPSLWPVVTPGLRLDPKIEQRVDHLLATLTWEEKVGQLVQADIGSITPEDLRRYKLGAILAGGSSAPGRNVHSSAARWLALAEDYYRASVADGSPLHPAIPILFGIDAVHGDGHVPGATLFPHNIGLGATHDPQLIEQIGRVTAEEVAVTGLDWTFAPTIAVVRDVRWGRTYESYSEDPALVAADARSMVSGLQGRVGTPDFMAPGHIIATAKHFLGDGGTLDGHDQGDNRSSEPTLRDVHGAGYRTAIEAGVLTVMASYSSWHGIKMHANHALLTDVLKGRWQFPGFVVGDWNAQAQVPGCSKFDCPQVLLAGVDMYMAADSWRELYANLLREVQSGRIPRARLDDAVRRILRVKVLAGLLDEPDPRERPDAGQYWRLGGPRHRAIARRAVRESLVLLKNNGQLLPLAPHERVLVAGPGANDIGMQCGGWTVDWQGAHNTNADFPGATSIFAGIKAAVKAAGGTAILSPDGTFSERPDVAIVVFGERPYAEGLGDRRTLEFSAENPGPLRMLRRLRAAGIPVVSVFLSGRPMWVNPELDASNAFVAAWLPGSEGEGIADLLFRRPNGTVRYDFTGRLGFSWPATALPVTFASSGTVQGALFARGFGLTVRDRQDLPHLSEDPHVAAASSTARIEGTISVMLSSTRLKHWGIPGATAAFVSDADRSASAQRIRSASSARALCGALSGASGRDPGIATASVDGDANLDHRSGDEELMRFVLIAAEVAPSTPGALYICSDPVFALMSKGAYPSESFYQVGNEQDPWWTVYRVSIRPGENVPVHVTARIDASGW